VLTAFSTRVYLKSLLPQRRQWQRLNQQLLKECLDLAMLDRAGVAWSRDNYGPGFTSYASANRMHENSPTFASLETLIRPHVLAYAKALYFDLPRTALRMSTCWVNLMPKGAAHGMHNHPLSVISGTYYVQTPTGSSPLQFEDPRYGLFMARPAIKARAPQEAQALISATPSVGQVILFESWLRHQVPSNPSAKLRISISFNYEWLG